jgi:predicted MFS family arabinose efflux permease
MPNSTASDSKTGGLILPALTLARTSPQARALLTSLLLIEIGQTYGTTIGVTNQINTANSVVAIIAALVMGLLSVKYRNRSLLLIGVILSIVSIVGCYFAPNFLSLLLIFSLGGFAANMITPMSTSLLGDYFPPSERSKVMGWLLAGPAFLYVIGYPIGNYLGDWRKAYMWFALPILLLTFIVCYIGIPKTEKPRQSGDILAGYKGIIGNKSALACLASYAMGLGVWQISLSLAASFYRQELTLSRTFVTNFTVLMAFAYIFGALLVGRVISRIGSQRTTILFVSLMGLSTLIRFTFDNVMIAISLGFLTCFFSGCYNSAVQSLNLGQVPDRGSMMSLTSAFGSVGVVVFLSSGGYLLIRYGWAIMGQITGLFALVAGIILYFFAGDGK